MNQLVKKVLVTGAQGFIGKNLVFRLNELSGYEVCSFVRGDDISTLPELINKADAVIHLAGENRPIDEEDYDKVNAGFTRLLCDAIGQVMISSGRKVPLIFASSTQAELDNAYGRSKRAAEISAKRLADETNNPVVVFRLPGVFGKWCKPNYNSVVATFCYNLARKLPIQIDDPNYLLKLVYVDDVVDAFIHTLKGIDSGYLQKQVQPEYTITLSKLAAEIESFNNCRTSLMLERVGTELTRALYATYVSYLPTENFAYEVPVYGDSRGVFVEMLKTPDCGQFSYFTALPGITRGGHYHHTKSEKFLVIKGNALFKFRNIITYEQVEFRTSGDKPVVVDTIPGWSHAITNVGNDEMLVMLWANENFDREKPDTVSSQV